MARAGIGTAPSSSQDRLGAGVAGGGVKGGDNLQSGGQAMLPTPRLPPLLPLHCLILQDERQLSVGPGDESGTTGPGGRAGGDG